MALDFWGVDGFLIGERCRVAVGSIGGFLLLRVNELSSSSSISMIMLLLCCGSGSVWFSWGGFCSLLTSDMIFSGDSSMIC